MSWSNHKCFNFFSSFFSVQLCNILLSVFVVYRPIACKPVTIECDTNTSSYCSVTSSINLIEGDTFYVINSNRSWDSSDAILEIHPQERSYIASIDSIFDYFPKLQQLFISNSLNELPSMQFSASTLRSINFRHNFIRNITKSAFDGAANLEHIDLSGNVIYTIDNEAFNGLDRLISICLLNNRLSMLHAQTFVGAKSLSHINLQNNSITLIADGCFALKNLEELNLAKNHLVMLANSTFNGAERLKKVSLAHNRIKVVDVVALAQAAPIEEFSFENNELGRFEKQSINCSNQLNYNLKHLNLASNGLQTAHIFDSLICMINLETLNLNRNKFTQFDNISDLRIYFPRLTIVHLIDNAINCEWLNQTAFDTSLIYTRPIRKFTIKGIVCIPWRLL